MEQRTPPKNKKLQVWLPLLFAIVMVTGMVIGYKIRENTQVAGSFLRVPGKSTAMQEVLALINLKYVDPVNTDTLTDEVIGQMLTKLDPHSIYIPPIELTDVNEDLQGNFQGIGVEFQIFKDTVNIISVLPGGPSEQAGVQVGDKLLKVSDTVVAQTGITSNRIRQLLKGPGGSLVKVLMLRGKETKELTIKRGLIPIPSVDAMYMVDSTTGYIRINKFSSTTYEEFMASLERLQSKKMQSLILDLRNNGGGVLSEAIDIADEFLDGDKLITYTQGNKLPRQEYRCKRQGLFEKGKLVVLIDENSASASEVLTGALQDWDRATILGRRSFGKGLVQDQYNLSNGGALRLTVARYYTPLGRSIQKPYTNGSSEDYQNDIMKRYQHGELVNADSNKIKNGKEYRTPSGKSLYGGGGIMPDIFVGLDTTLVTRVVSEVYRGNTVNNYAYQYYMQNQNGIKKFKNPVDFNSNFKYSDQLWNGFVRFAATDSLYLHGIPSKDKEFLEKRIKALLAKYVWMNNGYFEVINSDDPTLKKAVEVIEKN